jgi:hypothetical protein
MMDRIKIKVLIPLPLANFLSQVERINEIDKDDAVTLLLTMGAEVYKEGKKEKADKAVEIMRKFKFGSPKREESHALEKSTG